MELLYFLGVLATVFAGLSVVLYVRSTRIASEALNTENLLQERLQFVENEIDRLSTDLFGAQSKMNELNQLNLTLSSEKSEAQTLNRQLPDLKQEVLNLKTDLQRLSQVKESQAVEIERIETLLTEERKQFKEKLEILEDTKQQLKVEFENLAGQIFENNSKKFVEQNKSHLDVILSPLKTQMTDFKQKVENMYIDEAKERSALKSELKSLRELNEQISTEAENLTNALKKDVKTQGDWGEIKLEMVLQASGLTKGLEYDVQMNLKDSDGSNFRPDVVVHLPDNRDIIIDSKVSLTAYERYLSAETEPEKEAAMKLHVASLKKHIRELSEKNYHKLYGINSLDFVLMFVYNEASYIAAIDYDRELLKDAFNKKILIAAPFTLYGTLKIINSLWKYDEQNKNARDIADRATLLYDKFAGFTETLKLLGDQIDKVAGSYNDAVKKLSTGRGNLMSQAEKLIELGVVSNKVLPSDLKEIDVTDKDV